MSVDARFQRTESLLGSQAMEKLAKTRVAIFGLGGVGGNAFEALVRMGIGEFDLIDFDVFSVTNLNRQLLATSDAIGEKKTEIAKKRALSINPNVNIHVHDLLYLPEKENDLDFAKFDYVIDAIDTVEGKIGLILECQRLGIPVISCMGCGNRIDPSKLKVGDIHKTEMDPLAKVMRSRCRKEGIKKLKVVYSLEKPLVPVTPIEGEAGGKKNPPGSTSLVPPVAGILLASEVIKDLLSC